MADAGENGKAPVRRKIVCGMGFVASFQDVCINKYHVRNNALV